MTDFELCEYSENKLKEARKRIAELEYQLTHRNCLDCSNHSSKLRMRNLDLEKENAELKSENQKWKDEWQEQVQKATDEGYARTLQTIQLSKAKEHIRTLISCLIDWIQEGDKDYCYIADAEQFLNSEEEKGMTENSNVPECPSIKIGCDKMYYVDEVEK